MIDCDWWFAVIAEPSCHSQTTISSIRWTACKMTAKQEKSKSWLFGMLDELLLVGMVGWMDFWLFGWLDRWMVGWIDGWMGGWLDGLLVV